MAPNAKSAADYDKPISKLMLQDFDYDFVSARGLRFFCAWCNDDKGRPEEVQRHMKEKCAFKAFYPLQFPDSKLDYSLLRVSVMGQMYTAAGYVALLKGDWIHRKQSQLDLNYLLCGVGCGVGNSVDMTKSTISFLEKNSRSEILVDTKLGKCWRIRT